MRIHKHVQWMGPIIFLIFSICMLFHLINIKQIYALIKKTPLTMMLVRPAQGAGEIEPV